MASAAVATPAFAEDPPEKPEQVAIDPTRPSRPLPEPTEPVTVPEPTATDVAGAPRPGNESGRIDGGDGEAGIPRTLGRVILFVPRVALAIAFAPVRGGLDAYDRYQLRERWMRVFFNDARTIGVYPTLRISSDYGFDIGARFVARDLLGAREYFSLRAGVGQSGRRSVAGALRSGDRFGRVSLTLGGEYDLGPRDKFYGIGNSDEVDDDDIPGMIDPLVDDTAVETRYEQRLLRGSLIVDTHVASAFHVRAAGALTDLEFGPGNTGTPIDEVYLPERIVGFDGVQHAYGELELLWDNRAHSSPWESSAIDSVGSLAAIYAGRVAVFDGPDFWRVGGNAQHYLRLGIGPRTLALRAHLETVSGALDEVPFDELPKLGGSTLLRGYSTDRFRDRAAALGTVEYRWDLSAFLLAKLFVDAGRVAPSVGDLTVDDLRVGYGVGFEAYTDNSFLVRGSVASSIDGGIFFNISFDREFELARRVERR